MVRKSEIKASHKSSYLGSITDQHKFLPEQFVVTACPYSRQLCLYVSVKEAATNQSHN